MKQYILCGFFLLVLLFQFLEARLAGECVQLCNDLRTEVLTMEMCREAKRTLPRPKVGDFCSTAMEQGFSDACVPLCMDQIPVNRVAQTCRAAAIEMPRPTVRRWCEHGYSVAYQKTIEDLVAHFKPDLIKESRRFPADAPDDAEEEQTPAQSTPTTTSSENLPSEENINVYKESINEARPVLATIPVTLDDTTTKDLVVHEGQNAEEAVVEFCRENMSTEVSTCIRQLLNVVIERLAELSVNA